MEFQIQRLLLAAPVICPLKSGDPFENTGDENAAGAFSEEAVYRFELDPSQAMSFEPDIKIFIKNYTDESGPPDEKEPQTAIPAGNYLFVQIEGRLNEDEFRAVAAEIQQEGLWQRLMPGDMLFMRCLNEDGRDVTQVLRSYSLTASTM